MRDVDNVNEVKNEVAIWFDSKEAAKMIVGLGSDE